MPSQQYKNIAFYHNETQRQIIQESADNIAGAVGKVETEIIPYTNFYLAEAYHQKYNLRSNPSFMREFERMYPDSVGFINSTAAARVNGYLGRNADIHNIMKNVEKLGITKELQDKLLTYAAR